MTRRDAAVAICLLVLLAAVPRLLGGTYILDLGVLTFLGGTLLLCFPWIPLLEWSAHGSRQLMGGVSFAEAYSLNFKELLCVFLDERAAFFPFIPEHGGGYPLIVNGVVVGSVIVSGVPQQDDHALVVEALRALAG